MTWLQNQEASGLQQRLIVCVLSVTERSLSNVATRILIRTHKFRTGNQTRPPLCTSVSRNTWHPFKEPSFRYTAVTLRYLESKHVCKHVINTLPVTGLLFTGEPTSTAVLCYKNSLTHCFLWHRLCGSWTTGNYLLPSPIHTESTNPTCEECVIKQILFFPG
jgi:hypothetical protein